MKICYFLLILFLGCTRGFEDESGSIPCFPKCPLSDEGRRFCDSLLVLEPCVDLVKIQRDDAVNTCSCEWSEVLSHPGYVQFPGNSDCLLYSLKTCDEKIRHSRDTTDYSFDNFVLEIQKENSRIEKLTDETEKRYAKVRLANAVRDVIRVIRQLEDRTKARTEISGVKSSKNAKKLVNTEPKGFPDFRIMAGGWRTPKTTTTKKPRVKMTPLKNDKRFHIAMFASAVFLFLVVVILCLLAKIKTDRSGVNMDIVGDLDLDRRQFYRPTWRIFLDKLRLRCREKAEENARRGQPSRNLLPPHKIEKPPMAVPSKTSLGRKNSNTSVMGRVDKKSDSCTLISGLTHGNTAGSDVELNKEFSMFKTNFQEDFKSLLNLNEDK
ncbi:uncharacterized protein [Argopecten irradians]|uniref:uncharacterized protein isoform X1 n=1 Tax=Argopecten irradians TaxID=31199 RepID=UPI00371D44C4